MDKLKIELTHPIDIDGTKVSVLQLRRPKVRDMLSVEKSVDNVTTEPLAPPLIFS
jgi:hypothetical protein